MSHNPRKDTVGEREDKATILAAATDILSSRVGALADAVQTNNFKIDRLQAEVNGKPDDAEVKFITGLAHDERTKHLRYSLVTACVSAIISAMFSYYFATTQTNNLVRMGTAAAYKNCRIVNSRVDHAIDYYNTQAAEEETNKFIDNVLRKRRVDRLKNYADYLAANKNDCAGILRGGVR